MIILVCLAILGVLNLLYTRDQLDQTVTVFILETILLEAFGVSWLVKGETLFRDK